MIYSLNEYIMTKSSPFASELSPKYALLGFLYIRPMHGYDLHKHLETDLHEVWRISQSQAYNILKNLEKDGWITATLQQQEKRPDRELLTLTDFGKAKFEAWLYSPTPGSARAIRVEFITRLFFASNLDEDLCSRLIQEQADTIRSHLEELDERLRAIPPNQIFNRMGLDLRIGQLLSVLAWMENVMRYFVEGVD
jgi:PadR family transcriptional regulator, regulatory protein AphA